MSEIIDVWITRYALTEGITKERGRVIESDPSMVRLIDRPMGYAHAFDWHRTEAAAIARAEMMRQAKIRSLRKQLAKLEAMRFDGGEHDSNQETE